MTIGTDQNVLGSENELNILWNWFTGEINITKINSYTGEPAEQEKPLSDKYAFR